MKKLFYYSLLLYGGLYLYKAIKAKLKYFNITSFGPMFGLLSIDLIIKVDLFAYLVKQRYNVNCYISPASGTILRFGQGTTDHFLGRAIDIMIPQGITLKEGFDIAREVGLNAIGVYPYWSPDKGMHLGIRYPLYEIFTWADISQTKGKHNYVAIEQGFIK